MSKRASMIFGGVAISLATVFSSATASAKVGAPTAQSQTAAPIERVQPLLADVVVQGSQQPAPATPAPAPVVVQPQTTTPVVPVEETVPAPRRTTVVEHEEHNYMGTIFVSALAGGLAGALIGGAIYFLADDQTHAPRIAYWAAGGVLVGTGVGLTQILVQESRADRAAAMLPTDPAPTFRLALLKKTF